MDTKCNFSKSLRYLLTKNQISQTELANQTKISISYINALVNGVKKNPEVETLSKICCVFEIDLVDFFILSLNTTSCRAFEENEFSTILKKLKQLLEVSESEMYVVESLPFENQTTAKKD